MGVILTSPRPAHNSLNWDTVIEADLAALAGAINAASFAVPSSDWSQVLQSGQYYASSSVNAPGGSGHGFYVWDIHRGDNATAVQLAVDVNVDGALYLRRYISGAWQPWQQVATAATIQAMIGDTGWITSATGITAATGFTLTAAKYRIRNGLAIIGISGTWSGSTVAAGANGAIANTPIVNLPALLTPTATNGQLLNNGSAASFAAAGYPSQSLAKLVFTTAPGGMPSGGAVDAYASYYL